MAKDSNINPKDTKDLANSLSAAATEMQQMASYAESFNKNICGAVDCLAKITNSQKESKKHSNDIVDSTKDQSAALTDVAKKIEESNKALTKQSKIGKFINDGLKNTLLASKATLGVLGDMVGSSGFGGMMNSIKDIGGAFVSGGLILGPVSVLLSFASFIFDKFLEIDAAVEDVAKGIGRGGAKAREFAASSFDISRNFASYGISIKDASEAAVNLAGEFSNLDYLTKGNQTTVALMSKQLGIGSAEAAKSLGTFMNMRGASLETAKSTASFAMSVAKAANLPLPAIMQDLSQNSESAAKFGGKFTQSTIIASAMAKKMGISFGDIAKIAEGILDIETSVEKQFEAQVLLGREVNLEKARYYALTGDTKKLTGEVLKQVGSQAQFEKMMPMQRQALADAIGVGVEQLGKMVSRQKEGLSVEEKTLALEEKAFDTQLKESGKMVGVVTQIEGALTQLGYAIMGFFGVNVSDMYKEGAAMGENFVKMIQQLTNDLVNGRGPLFDFLTGIQDVAKWIKEAIVVMYEWKWIILAVFGAIILFKGIMAITALISLFGGAVAATAVSSVAATPGIIGMFSSLVGGLSLLWPVAPILALVVAGIVGIGVAFLGIGMAIGGIADLGIAFQAFSNIDVSNIDNVFSSFKSNLVTLNKNKEVGEMISKIESLSAGMNSISKFSGAAVTIKSNTEIANGQQRYYSESIKYLKIIALSTAILAEKTGKDVSLRTLDRDLAILN